MWVFNLSNKENQIISHEQFLEMVGDFKEAVELNIGPTKMNIAIMDQPKEVTTYVDDDIYKKLNQKNDESVVRYLNNPSGVTPAMWAESRYVQVGLKVPQSNMGHYIAGIEFRGLQPQAATFFVQNDEDAGPEVLMYMLEACQDMKSGNGDGANARMSELMPDYIFDERISAAVYEGEEKRLEQANEIYKQEAPKSGGFMGFLRKLVNG